MGRPSKRTLAARKANKTRSRQAREIAHLRGVARTRCLNCFTATILDLFGVPVVKPLPCECAEAA